MNNTAWSGKSCRRRSGLADRARARSRERTRVHPSTRRRRVLPGFGLSLGYTLLYLGLIVLIPLSAAFIKTAQLTWTAFIGIVTEPRVVASYHLTFGASASAAAINAVFGLLVAWVLVRYRFPGQRFVDALVDLPFALPTAVAGIALTGLFAPNGWFGALLPPLGINVAFTPLGVVVALTFIGLPFVVRTVQPVLEELPESSKKPPPRWARRAGRASGALSSRSSRRPCSPDLRSRSRAPSASTDP